MDKNSLLSFEKCVDAIASFSSDAKETFNHCRPPRCWTPRARSRCRSAAGTLRCRSPPRMLGPTLPRMLVRASRAAIHPPIPTGSFCSRCPTAPSRTAAAPVASWPDGRCLSCRRRRPGRSDGGFPPRCWSGSCRPRTRCQMQCASCAPLRRPIPTRCLFVWRKKKKKGCFLALGVVNPLGARFFIRKHTILISGFQKTDFKLNLKIPYSRW